MSFYRSVLAGCIVCVTVCVCLLLLSVRAAVVCLPLQVEVLSRALAGEVASARVGLAAIPGDLAGRIVPPVMGEVSRLVAGDPHGATLVERSALRDLLLAEVHGQLSDFRADLRAESAAYREAFLLAAGKADSRLAEATGTLDGLRSDLRPVLDAAARLGANYAALPDRFAQSPAWLSLEPEITCRKPDGTGYGGCWHARITGLFGEAERVGGVFTQQFPSLAGSVTGIAGDVHGFADKYVMPHPMKTGDYFKAAGRITLGLGVAGLRGGVF